MNNYALNKLIELINNDGTILANITVMDSKGELTEMRGAEIAGLNAEWVVANGVKYKTKEVDAVAVSKEYMTSAERAIDYAIMTKHEHDCEYLSDYSEGYTDAAESILEELLELFKVDEIEFNALYWGSANLNQEETK